MAIYRGPGGSGDATDDAANAAELIIQKTDEAAAYAASASTSATNADASATSAAASASGVSASAAAAAASAAAALVSETNAADSEVNAAISAANADEDAGTASTKANEASDSADAAAASASAAASSASSASTSASNAASSASSASSNASAASTSASNAAISEANAASSAATAAGYVPSLTGNTGKYLRTNGTSNYWDTVTDVNAATPLNDGLVFGQTDSQPGTWSGTITNNGNYLYFADGGNYNISFAASSAVGVAAAAGQIAIGQLITINDGTTTRDFGVITGVTASDPTYITTSLQPYGNPWIDVKYCASMTLVGSPGGNVGLGYNIYDNVTVGSYNTVLGYNAGASIVGSNNNIVIGYNADASSTSAANEVTLGNTDIAKTRLRGAILVGNSSPSAGTSGQVLTSNGSSSEPSWTTLSTGTVTSVALSAPTGLTVSGSPITSSGTLALSYTAGYSIPTDTKQTNWDTAYGWGNHASAGYLTSATAASTYAPLTGTGTSGTWGISITGNSATVTNGLYSTGTYSNPTWLTTLAGSKITGTIDGGTY